MWLLSDGTMAVPTQFCEVLRRGAQCASAVGKIWPRGGIIDNTRTANGRPYNIGNDIV